MRIQHPRATDAFARDPPSRVAVRVGPTRYTTVGVDANGYLSIKPEKADDVMDDLESSYDVEYDRDTGEVIVDDPDGDPDPDSGDDPPDDETDADDGAGDTDDAALEAWANWNEDDWLTLNWGDRRDDVEAGLVDDHLDRIIDIETSTNVRDAAKQRLEDLERGDSTGGEAIEE